jgi:ankyrin repeat protein
MPNETGDDYTDDYLVFARNALNNNLTIVDDGDAIVIREPNWDSIKPCFRRSNAALDVRLFRSLRPLHVAVMWGDLDACEFLLNNGADPRACDSNGNNALHNLVFCWQTQIQYPDRSARYTRCAQALIDGGLYLDAVNNEGDSPLQLSAFIGNETLVALLLRNNARPDYCNAHGEEGNTTCHRLMHRYRTPLECALWKRHWRIAMLLVESGATKTCNWPRLESIARADTREHRRGLLQPDVAQESFQNGSRPVLRARLVTAKSQLNYAEPTFPGSDPEEAEHLLESIKNWSKLRGQDAESATSEN